MKTMIATTLFASAAFLAGCASPAADNAADNTGDAINHMSLFEDKGELLTGSRIPQKSTAHILKRIGSAEYKKAQMQGGQHNPPTPAGGK